MSPARLRAVFSWTLGLLLLGLAAAAAAALTGRRLEACCGAAAGGLLGALGHLFAARAAGPGRAWKQAWGLWLAGLLARLGLLLVLTLIFWRAWPESFGLPALIMAAIYLLANLWDVGWLCRRAAVEERHG